MHLANTDTLNPMQTQKHRIQTEYQQTQAHTQTHTHINSYSAKTRICKHIPRKQTYTQQMKTHTSNMYTQQTQAHTHNNKTKRSSATHKLSPNTQTQYPLHTTHGHTYALTYPLQGCSSHQTFPLECKFCEVEIFF